MSTCRTTRSFVASAVLILFTNTQILSQSWANSVPPEEEIQNQTPTVSVSSNVLTQDNGLETNTTIDFLTNQGSLSEASQFVIQSLSIGSGRTYYPIVLVEINNGNPITADSHVTLTLAALSSSPTADANKDGAVDSADYVIWRKLNGAHGGDLVADFNNNGVVDDADYLIWRANFGKTSVITDMRFSTDGVNFGDWVPYQSTYEWNFSSTEGIKTIYVQVRDNNSTFESPVVSDSIFLTDTSPLPFLDVTSTNALSTLTNPWIIDLNGDGVTDAFDLDEVLINLGDGTFQHSATTGISAPHKNFADFNNDGWIDLLSSESATSPGEIIRYDNNQANGFPTGYEIAGVARFGPWLADFDEDGFLDMLGGGSSGFVTTGDQAYFIYDESQGSGTYSVTRMFPAPEYSGYGEHSAWAVSLQSAVIRDFDQDGDQDIYFTVLLVEGGPYRTMYRHYIFRNDGNRQFTRTAQIGDSYTPPFNTLPTTFSSTTETADFNNDGNWDAIIDNYVYFGNGDLTFTKGPAVDIPGFASPNRPTKSRFGDINNDGFVDILTYHRSEDNLDIIITTYLGDGTGNFISVDSSTFTVPQAAGSDLVTFTDFDGDGAVDIYAGGKVLKNQNTENHWLRLKLIAENSNRDAIGTKITVRTGNVTQTRVIEGALESERVAHFGLGDAGVVDELTIEWPNGLVQTYQNVTVDQLMVLQDQLTGGAGLSVPATLSSSNANQPSLQSRFRTPLPSSSFATQKKAEEDDFGKWDFSRSSSRYRNPKKRYLSFTSANVNRRPSF